MCTPSSTCGGSCVEYQILYQAKFSRSVVTLVESSVTTLAANLIRRSASHFCQSNGTRAHTRNRPTHSRNLLV